MLIVSDFVFERIFHPYRPEFTMDQAKDLDAQVTDNQQQKNFFATRPPLKSMLAVL